MLVMPEGGASFFNIVGLDPGTHHLGFGILTIEFGTFNILAATAYTVTALKHLPNDAWAIEVHGERTARIQVLGNAVMECFNYYRPLRIASESPFINPRHPHAGLALTEVITKIRDTVWRYDRWRSLQLIDPPTVKNAVGARGDGSKDAVKKRVVALLHPVWRGSGAIEDLDEHAIDGMAVAYSDYISLKG